MPVERVSITSDNITLKNSLDAVIFNTNFKYIKTASDGNLKYSIITPSISVTTTSSGNPANAVGKTTGVVFYSVRFANVQYGSAETIYATYRVPGNGKLIHSLLYTVMFSGDYAGGINVNVPNLVGNLFDVYVDDILQCHLVFSYYQTNNGGYLVFPFLVNNLVDQLIVSEFSVYTNQVIKFVREGPYIHPISQTFTLFSEPTNLDLLYNSGDLTIPLKVTV
jgi:hypothetical protein